MFKVYWTTADGTHSKDFKMTELNLVLDFMNTLREDVDISFVTMCSQNPNQVGKMGVAEAGSEYSWTKRRDNERKVSGRI